MRFLFILGSVITVFLGCSPKIHSFSVSRMETTSKDTVFFNWKTRGTPSLFFDQKKIIGPGEDSLRVLEFTLVASKNGKFATKKAQVTLREESSTDVIMLPVISASADSLIASASKDGLRWNDFHIISISAATDRPLAVYHAGVTCILRDRSETSNIFRNMPYTGTWEVHFAKTAAEKGNSSLIPSFINLKATIQKN